MVEGVSLVYHLRRRLPDEFPAVDSGHLADPARGIMLGVGCRVRPPQRTILFLRSENP